MARCDPTQRWLIFLAHANMVRAYIRRFANDAEEAEDLFQEVSLTTWRHPTGPRDPAKFGPWCRGLVRNAVFEQRRRRRGERGNISLDLDKPDDAREPEAIFGAEPDAENLVDLRQQLGRCLHGTSQAAQLLLVRRYVLEETAADIASELGNSAVSVRMKLKRARARLAASLRD